MNNCSKISGSKLKSQNVQEACGENWAQRQTAELKIELCASLTAS